jgi:hypothetical protein
MKPVLMQFRKLPIVFSKKSLEVSEQMWYTLGALPRLGSFLLLFLDPPELRLRDWHQPARKQPPPPAALV